MDVAFIAGTGRLQASGNGPNPVSTMPVLHFEYPAGSGKLRTVPPQIFVPILSGFRITLPNNEWVDLPDGLDIYTDRGFVPVFELEEEPTFLVLDEATYSHQANFIPSYVGQVTYSLLQQRRALVLGLDPITHSTAQLSFSYGTFLTRTTPAIAFTCALAKDPCGIEYIIPVTQS